MQPGKPLTEEDRIRQLLMAVQETPMGMASQPLTDEDYQRFRPSVFGGVDRVFRGGPQAPDAYKRRQYKKPPAPDTTVGIDGEPMAKGRNYTGVPLN
jgi:hypothetical protein